MSINPHFKTFLGLPEAERRIAYESAADMLNTSDKYIEKDLWTCHVLDALFNTVTTERTRLLFKGGTSLSKGYNVIQRFSEDIDINEHILGETNSMEVPAEIRGDSAVTPSP